MTHDTFTAASVFRLACPLDELPGTLRLRGLEWSVLLATSGRHTVAQIGAVFGLSAATRDAAFAGLAGRGLIVERELTRAEHETAAKTLDPDEPVPLAAFLSGAAAPPFVPLGPVEPEEPPPRRLSLRALMDFLVEGAVSSEEGQLNVYRAFIRLDPQRLQRHGIKTLRFEDDRYVEDPELQVEIVAAVEATLGRPCPDRVFV